MIELDKKFYINVGDKGTFTPSDNPLYDTTAENIDTIINHLRDSGQKRKIVLYFHGGLNNDENGMTTAERVHRYVTTGTDSHPITFVWETGLIDTVKQNFDTIFKSDFFKKLLVKVIKVAGKNLGIDLDDTATGSKGIGSMSDEQIMLQLLNFAPFENVSTNEGKKAFSLQGLDPSMVNDAYIDTTIRGEVQNQMEDELQSDPAMAILAQQAKAPEEAALMKNDLAENGMDGEKGILTLAKLIKAAVDITIAVIKRSVKKRGHGFYPTVLEEIFREIYLADVGTWVWGRMKDKARQMWQKDDFVGDPKGWHAGTYLLKRLLEYQSEVGDLTIDLVGHSAGSIVICELIDAVAKKNLKLHFRHIIFMAPACRCELFSDTILKNKSLFDDLRIFTMSDDYEIKDHLVGVVYPRSLLYLISGILEENEFDAYILGLQRHITGLEPYASVGVLNEIKDYLLQSNRVVYSVTKEGALAGFISGSQRHGDFDNDHETTMDSIICMIK